MNLHKQEDHHNSAEQVHNYCVDAIKIVDKLKLSDRDRETLLPGILSLLAAKQVFYEQVPTVADLGAIARKG